MGGSSWTEISEINTARYAMGSGGTYTSAIAAGGEPKTGKTEFQVANTETWNGSTWTETGDLNRYTKECGGVAADNTAAIAIAGSKSGSPENDSRCETWNGSSWTELSDLNTAKGVNVSWGTSNSNAIVTTGEPGYGTTTSSSKY